MKPCPVRPRGQGSRPWWARGGGRRLPPVALYAKTRAGRLTSIGLAGEKCSFADGAPRLSPARPPRPVSTPGLQENGEEGVDPAAVADDDALAEPERAARPDQDVDRPVAKRRD